MKLKEHIANHRFNIQWNRAHPQTRITEQQQLLHLAERQIQLAEYSTERGEREVVALEQIAIALLNLLNQ